MQESEIVRHEHITVNGRFRVCFEKAPSANKIDGFKVEANGDDHDQVKLDAETLYNWAIKVVEANKPQVQIPEKK